MKDKRYYEQEASLEEYLDWYRKQDSNRYAKPCYTVDMIALAYQEGQIFCPLIQRKSHPFRGSYALPSGFVTPTETGKQAAIREVREEIGLTLSEEMLYTLDTYDNPHRDPRGWVISKTHIVYLPRSAHWEIEAGDDAVIVRWAQLDIMRKQIRLENKLLASDDLAFDHYQMLQDAMERIQGLTAWNPRYLRLLGDTFTLSEATTLTNLFLEKSIQVTNFKRDYSYCLEATNYQKTNKIGRPSTLYRYVERKSFFN